MSRTRQEQEESTCGNGDSNPDYNLGKVACWPLNTTTTSGRLLAVAEHLTYPKTPCAQGQLVRGLDET